MLQHQRREQMPPVRSPYLNTGILEYLRIMTITSNPFNLSAGTQIIRITFDTASSNVSGWSTFDFFQRSSRRQLRLAIHR